MTRKFFTHCLTLAELPDIYRRCVVYNCRVIGMTHHGTPLMSVLHPHRVKGDGHRPMDTGSNPLTDLLPENIGKWK